MQVGLQINWPVSGCFMTVSDQPSVLNLGSPLTGGDEGTTQGFGITGSDGGNTGNDGASGNTNGGQLGQLGFSLAYGPVGTPFY